MRRTVVSVVALAVAAVPAGAHAAAPKKPKKHTRTVTVEYRANLVFHAAGTSGTACTVGPVEASACTDIPLRADEHYFKIVGTDSSGQPVAIQWHQGSAGVQADYNGVAHGCGRLGSKLKRPKQIAVYAGTNVPECPVMTTGKLVVTISNYPV